MTAVAATVVAAVEPSAEVAHPTLSRRTLASLSAVSIPLAALSLPLVVMIPEHYANALGLPLALVGILFTAVRVFDIVLDPLLGGLMDRTRTRWGRYKAWLVGGAPLLMASTAMLFMARPGVGPVWLFIGLLATFTAWSILTLAQLSLAAGLTTGYDDRSRIYAWLQSAFLIGMTAVMALPLLLGGARGGPDGVATMGWLIIALTPLAVALAAWRTPEAEAPVARPHLTLGSLLAVVRRRAVWQLALADLLFGLGFGVASVSMVFFFTAVQGLERSAVGVLLIAQTVTAIVTTPVVTAAADRMGKPAALALFGVVAAVVAVILPFLPDNNLIASAIGFAGWGVSVAAFNLLPRAMMADAGDELRLDSGRDQTGVLYAALISSWKLGGALSVGIMFIALAAIGYQPALGGGNSPGALLGLTLLFSGPSALLFLAGAALAWTYPLTRARHAEIRVALDRWEAVA